jgi:hypothetical protein
MKKSGKGRYERKKLNHHILLLSTWSFTMVISSFLFMFAGRWIDVEMNTEPTFMLGLLILGIGLCIGRMYTDYVKAKNAMDKKKITYQAQFIVKKAG